MSQRMGESSRRDMRRRKMGGSSVTWMSVGDSEMGMLSPRNPKEQVETLGALVSDMRRA